MAWDFPLCGCVCWRGPRTAAPRLPLVLLAAAPAWSAPRRRAWWQEVSPRTPGKGLCHLAPPPFFLWNLSWGSHVSVLEGAVLTSHTLPVVVLQCSNWRLKFKSGEQSLGSGVFASLGDPAGLAKPGCPPAPGECPSWTEAPGFPEGHPPYLVAGPWRAWPL